MKDSLFPAFNWLIIIMIIIFLLLLILFEDHNISALIAVLHDVLNNKDWNKSLNNEGCLHCVLGS